MVNDMSEISIKAGVLRETLDVISSLVDEAKFRFDEEGLKIRAVDPAHVAMVDLALSKSAFETYEVEPMEMGVNLPKVQNHLKGVKADSIVILKVDDDTGRLTMNIENLTVKMPLIDLSEMTEPKIPDLPDMKAQVKVHNSTEVLKAVKASESISDYITLDMQTEDVLNLYSSEELSSMNLELRKGKDYDVIQFSGPARSSFSLDYFSQIMKAIGGEKELELHLGVDYPLKMLFHIGEGEGRALYLLAPRIENV
ncbi:DNA polymerase sliding clamp [Thermoplasmatales archaeon ex4484_36]|nr:MAG: DNA polymerase sliding clamp [Thermoplasmatales archaeon ex4484_36]